MEAIIDFFKFILLGLIFFLAACDYRNSNREYLGNWISNDWMPSDPMHSDIVYFRIEDLDGKVNARFGIASWITPFTDILISCNTQNLCMATDKLKQRALFSFELRNDSIVLINPPEIPEPESQNNSFFKKIKFVSPNTIFKKNENLNIPFEK